MLNLDLDEPQSKKQAYRALNDGGLRRTFTGREQVFGRPHTFSVEIEWIPSRYRARTSSNGVFVATFRSLGCSASRIKVSRSQVRAFIDRHFKE